MSLTGSQVPQGTINTQEDLFLEGGPEVYFADRAGNYRFNPDSDGFYWGLSGTATYPVFQVGCYENFRFADSVEITDVRCDTIGVTSSIQKRNFLEIEFDLKAIFPFAHLRHMLKGGGAVTNNASDEKSAFGLGRIDNNQFWKVFFPLVYDEAAADYVSVTLHKVQFVDAWEWAWSYGQSHQISIKMRAFAEATNVPAGQRFATFVRIDPSVIS